MNSIAAVLHRDRHADPEIFLFVDPAKAIAFAKARVLEFDRFNDRRENEGEALSKDARRLRYLYQSAYGEDGTIDVQLRDLQDEPSGVLDDAECDMVINVAREIGAANMDARWPQCIRDAVRRVLTPYLRAPLGHVWLVDGSEESCINCGLTQRVPVPCAAVTS